MFKQVMHLKAAFAHRESMVIVYNSADQGRVVLKAPPNGFPAGHPLSGNFCSIAAKAAWDYASNLCFDKCMLSAGNPVPGSPEYKNTVALFRDSNLSIMFVDDGAFYGPPHALIERVGEFARICGIRGVGSFSKKKTQLSMVNREPACLLIPRWSWC